MNVPKFKERLILQSVIDKKCGKLDRHPKAHMALLAFQQLKSFFCDTTLRRIFFLLFIINKSFYLLAQRRDVRRKAAILLHCKKAARV